MNTNEKAGIYAIVGGLLMLIAGVTGAATWVALGDMAVDITGQESLRMIFQVMALVGSLGGLVVILGGFLIRKGKSVSAGKFLITLGAGFGLIGLLIFLAITFLADNPGGNIMAALSLGFVGLVLSIIARLKAQS